MLKTKRAKRGGAKREGFKTEITFDKEKIKKAIKAETHSQEGVTACKINCFLSDIPNFLGCFASAQRTENFY